MRRWDALWGVELYEKARVGAEAILFIVSAGVAGGTGTELVVRLDFEMGGILVYVYRGMMIGLDWIGLEGGERDGRTACMHA